MTPEDEITRGHKATRLLSDDIYTESWTEPRNRIIHLLESVELDDAKRARLNSALQGLALARRYVEQVAMTGRMAAEQIERDKTFTERVSERVRRVI